jgi:hypothetical protein
MRILSIILGLVVFLGAIEHGYDFNFACFVGGLSGYGINYLSC